jgi:RNA polymerase sigma factor (sigma-70 family)
MATTPLTKAVRHIRSTSFLLDDGGSFSDGQLLEQFLLHGEEYAFKSLVERHGPMVFGTCRRILRNTDDAEDAFQATFLVLVRQGRSMICRANIGSWLHGVAVNLALKSRAQAARQTRNERQAWERGRVGSPFDNSWDELLPFLDAELARLPGKYRESVVLCDLEGKTQKETARQLGLPEGTVSSRLSRGRTLLAKRLSRYRLAVSAGAVMGILAQDAIAVDMPAGLVMSSVKVAALFARGKMATTGIVSAKVIMLANGALRSALLSQQKIVGALLLAFGMVAVGANVYRSHSLAESYGAARSEETNIQEPKPKDTAKTQDQPTDQEALRVKRFKIARLLEQASDALMKCDESARYNRSRVLDDIAVEQYRAGEAQASKGSFARAKEFIGPEPEFSEDLRMHAQALARAGDAAAVRALVPAISQMPAGWKEPDFHDVVITESAWELAKNQQIKEALLLIDEVKDPKYRTFAADQARQYYVLALAKLGKFRAAEAALQMARNPEEKIFMIAGYLVQNFSCFDYPWQAGIALVAAKAGERTMASKLMQQARLLLPSVPESDQARAALACAYARLGDLQNCSELLKDLPKPPWRPLAVASYVKALAIAGKDKEAEAVLAPLEKGELVHALYHYATGQYEAGDSQAAKRSFARAQQVLNTMTDKQGHDHNLLAARARADDMAVAVAALQDDPANRGIRTTFMMEPLAKIGDFEAARELAAGLIEDQMWRGYCFREIAKCQAAKGKEEDAMLWIRKLPDDYDKANALLGVAEGMAERKP